MQKNDINYSELHHWRREELELRGDLIRVFRMMKDFDGITDEDF